MAGKGVVGEAMNSGVTGGARMPDTGGGEGEGGAAADSRSGGGGVGGEGGWRGGRGDGEGGRGDLWWSAGILTTESEVETELGDCGCSWRGDECSAHEIGLDGRSGGEHGGGDGACSDGDDGGVGGGLIAWITCWKKQSGKETEFIVGEAVVRGRAAGRTDATDAGGARTKEAAARTCGGASAHSGAGDDAASLPTCIYLAPTRIKKAYTS